MAEIKEIPIQTIGEPFSVKIEKNSKGYNYEIGVHAATSDIALVEIAKLKKGVEEQINGGVVV